MNHRILLTLAAGICWSAFTLGTVRADNTVPAGSSISETPAQHDARMAWFREARFGMFIHWGLFSEAAGEWQGQKSAGFGEWIMNDLHIPATDYEKLAGQFNPTNFNAREWVRVAKDAGVKYIVITTKHHDGFNMFDSKVSDYSIVRAAPFKRDPMKELAAACKEAGITLCFYHSIMDWHHPDAQRTSFPNYNDAQHNPNFPSYVENYLKPEVKELLTNYGPIGIIWFDGEWIKDWTGPMGKDMYAWCRSFQPGVIVNNRVGKDRRGFGESSGPDAAGDYMTPEQQIPPNGFGAGVDWESCMTMNNTWGFVKGDDHWKSTTTIVRNLIDCASKGGNYLLNVGPTSEGLIPDPSIERLKEVGQWMKVNGETIYGTTASPFARQLPWGRCTTKISGGTTRLFLHVFNWPDDGELLVPGLKNKIKTAYLLTEPEKKKLAVNNGEDGLTVSLPMTAPDKISSTIVLEFKGVPDVQPMPILQKRNGSVLLPAIEARLHGGTIQYESGGPLDNIGYWLNSSDWADWEFKVTKPGRFTVTADIATPVLTAFELSVAGQTLRTASPVTGNYGTFQTVTLGVVEIPAAGIITLAVHPIKDGWQPMNVKAIRLEPVAANP